MNVLLVILLLVCIPPAIDASSNECTQCCKPWPYMYVPLVVQCFVTLFLFAREITFNLQFIIETNETSNTGESVRLEYQYQGTVGKWQTIQNYAPSPQQLQESFYVSTAEQDLCAVALNVTELPKSEFHQEFISTDNSSVVIRWVQSQDKRAASWLIDNITMTYWDGECVKILLQQDFEKIIPSQE